MNAGLIDEGETAEIAAIRELQEETGFKADGVLESTPVIVADPGTNAVSQFYPSLYCRLIANLRHDDRKYEIGRTQCNPRRQNGDASREARTRRIHRHACR